MRIITALVAAAFAFASIPSFAQTKAEERRESPAQKAREAKAKAKVERAERKVERGAKKATCAERAGRRDLL